MALENLTILLTRPKLQALPLGNSLKALGAKVIFFPTITICPLETPELVEQMKQLNLFDLAIFISPNAVTHAITLINKYWPHWPATVKIATIGPGTTNALKKYNLNVDYSPETNFSTEGLLELPLFKQVKGKKIILFKGQGGRELLGNTLVSRGATLTEASVYRRELPQTPQNLLPETQINIIICTSGSGLENLVQMISPMHRSWLQNMSLLVASERVAALAKKLGFVKSPVIADNATDAAIIDALNIWQEKVHGKSVP